MMYVHQLVVSVSADQKIRFWDFDVTTGRQPLFTLYGEHEKLDSLSAIATTDDNNWLITADTAGSMKLWDFTDHKFRVDLTSDNIHQVWFIQAHRRVVNCINIVEIGHGDGAGKEKFIVSSSNDHNIQLTRFIDGVHIGQFG